MHLLKIILLYLLDHVVKVKNSENMTQFFLSPQNHSAEDSQWKLKENDTVEAFKTLNIHRAHMKDFLYRKFLLSSLMSKKNVTFTNKNQTERREIDNQIDNAKLNRYKSWLHGSKGSPTKAGIYLQNFASHSPAAADKAETNAEDKDVSAGTAFSANHGNVMPLRNYTYPPTIYKKKHNKIIINGPDPKGMLQPKIYPPSVNKLSKDQLEAFGAILLKNRYFANRIIGEQRQQNSEPEFVNGDYTVNQPSVDYGAPSVFTTNMATEKTILYITTEAPITAISTESFYNYMNFESSTAVYKPTMPSDQISPMEMLNPPNRVVSDNLVNLMSIPVNSAPYMNPSNAISPSYGLPMSSMNLASPMNPPYPINSMIPIAQASRPVYSAPGAEFYSPDSSSILGDDNMPYIIEDHTHCACKESISSSDGDLTDSDGNGMDFTDSDIYDAILTTIAFMAFGTYFISMMMKINEKNPGSTLMVVENGGNMENGRNFEGINDDFYLNSLIEEVVLFIDNFQQLMLEQPEKNSTVYK